MKIILKERKYSRLIYSYLDDILQKESIVYQESNMVDLNEHKRSMVGFYRNLEDFWSKNNLMTYLSHGNYSGGPHGLLRLGKTFPYSKLNKLFGSAWHEPFKVWWELNWDEFPVDEYDFEPSGFFR